MGSNMARRLLKNGYQVVRVDHQPEVAKKLAKELTFKLSKNGDFSSGGDTILISYCNLSSTQKRFLYTLHQIYKITPMCR